MCVFFNNDGNGLSPMSMSSNKDKIVNNQKDILDQVKGGSYTKIMKTLANVLKEADVIIANVNVIIDDAKVAKTHRDYLEQGALAPLIHIKTKIDQYVAILLPKKGEKRFIAEQLAEKNKELNNMLSNMAEKSKELEKLYNEYIALKAKLKNIHLSATMSNSDYTPVLDQLKNKCKQYTTEVSQFINRQVNRVKQSLEHLDNEAEFHTSLDDRKHIKGTVTPSSEEHKTPN
jgi:hypothetical protein